MLFSASPEACLAATRPRTKMASARTGHHGRLDEWRRRRFTLRGGRPWRLRLGQDLQWLKRYLRQIPTLEFDDERCCHVAIRGVLELHTWGSRTDKLERPDRLVFNLDPGPGGSLGRRW